MVFVYLEGYADGAPSYTTCPDANARRTPRVAYEARILAFSA